MFSMFSRFLFYISSLAHIFLSLFASPKIFNRLDMKWMNEWWVQAHIVQTFWLEILSRNLGEEVYYISSKGNWRNIAYRNKVAIGSVAACTIVCTIAAKLLARQLPQQSESSSLVVNESWSQHENDPKTTTSLSEPLLGKEYKECSGCTVGYRGTLLEVLENITKNPNEAKSVCTACRKTPAAQLRFMCTPSVVVHASYFKYYG